MKPVWTADFEVTEPLVIALISEQFPDIRIEHIELIGAGWDNSAYLINDGLVFRFPRRRLAAGLIGNEARWLADLAPNLPISVSAPAYIGKRSAAYPYPFAGYQRIPGTTADRATLTEQQRSALAGPLGQFLRKLHRIPVSPAVLASGPRDEIGRTDLPKRLSLMRERVVVIRPLLENFQVDADLILDLAAGLAAAPISAKAPCWVHGDLYARHLLVDDRRELCGVIDWGDTHLGDSALDISIAYSFLPSSGRRSFFAAYGEIDATAHTRARFRALNYGVILLEYGSEIGDDALVATAVYALRSATVTSLRL